jgi:hypothetical protein
MMIDETFTLLCVGRDRNRDWPLASSNESEGARRHTMSTARTPAPQRSTAGGVWIARLFALKTDQFHPVLGIIATATALVPLLVLKAVDHEELWLSFTFAVLFTMVSDMVVSSPYATRLRWSLGFVLVGTLLTALGYLLGGATWSLVALAVFVTTLLSYLMAVYGRRGALAGILLNMWFLVSLSVALSLHKSPAQTWPLIGPQALAWLAGGVLWMVVAWALWMLQQGRRAREQQGQEHQAQGQQATSAAPSSPDTAPASADLAAPLVVFALLAAVAVAIATAIAWGFAIPNADWMPVATVVAMKSRLADSISIAAQRVAGTLIGAIASAILLSFVHDQTVIIVIMVVVCALGVALHEVNYALYCACIAMIVLTALGLPHPGDLADNWQRVAWTFVGVGIALVVMFLADVVHPRAGTTRRRSVWRSMTA